METMRIVVKKSPDTLYTEVGILKYIPVLNNSRTCIAANFRHDLFEDKGKYILLVPFDSRSYRIET